MGWLTLRGGLLAAPTEKAEGRCEKPTQDMKLVGVMREHVQPKLIGKDPLKLCLGNIEPFA